MSIAFLLYLTEVYKVLCLKFQSYLLYATHQKTNQGLGVWFALRHFDTIVFVRAGAEWADG